MSGSFLAGQSGSELDRLALAHGIDLKRPTPDGQMTEISDDTKRTLLHALHVDLPDVVATYSGGAEAMPRASTSAGICFLPDVLTSERV